MAVTFTKEFYINLVLFVVACVALGLSIWAFAKPCKIDKFGDNPPQDYSNYIFVTKLPKLSTDKVDNKTIKKIKSQIQYIYSGPDFYGILCKDIKDVHTQPGDFDNLIFAETDNPFYKNTLFSNQLTSREGIYYSTLACDKFKPV